MPKAFSFNLNFLLFIGWADRNFSLEIANMGKKKPKKTWDKSDFELTTIVSCLVWYSQRFAFAVFGWILRKIQFLCSRILFPGKERTQRARFKHQQEFIVAQILNFPLFIWIFCVFLWSEKLENWSGNVCSDWPRNVFFLRHWNYFFIWCSMVVFGNLGGEKIRIILDTTPGFSRSWLGHVLTSHFLESCNDFCWKRP